MWSIITYVTDALGDNTLYSYDAAGNLASQTDGNGNTTTFRYNEANLIVAKTDPAANGNPAGTESYTYNPNGLMATKTDRKGITTAYTYDIFGRKLSEDAGGEIQSYVYDKNKGALVCDKLVYERLKLLQKQKSDKLINEMELRRIRTKAKKFWRDKNYKQYINLFEGSQIELSFIELKKLEYAYKRIDYLIY
jgi:YD repeat-containing protein